MNKSITDGRLKPRSICRSFFGSGELTVGVIAVVCLLVVLVCHRSWVEQDIVRRKAVNNG